MKKTKKNKKKAAKGPFAFIMTGYYPTTCNDVPDHSCDPCETVEYGRLRSAGFIKSTFAFTDETSTAEWQAGQQSGDIIVIPKTNGELPEPSEKTAPGYGDVVEQLISYEYQAKFTDPNFASNCTFYNTIKGRTGWKFFFRTSSKTYITPVEVTIIPKFGVQNDLNSLVNWNVTVKWLTPMFPCPFNTPENIFDECFETGN